MSALQNENMDHDHNKFLPTKKGIGITYAWNGLLYFFRTQKNARVHAIIALLVILFGWLLNLAVWEWLVVVLCIGFVFSAELLNTAIEGLTDLVAPGYNKKAGTVKDLAAGGVLLAAIAAAVAGLIIFIPKIYTIIGTWSGIY